MTGIQKDRSYSFFPILGMKNGRRGVAGGATGGGGAGGTGVGVGGGAGG